MVYSNAQQALPSGPFWKNSCRLVARRADRYIGSLAILRKEAIAPIGGAGFS